MNLTSTTSQFRRSKGYLPRNASVPPCQRKNRRHPKHCPDVRLRKQEALETWAFVLPVKRGKDEHPRI